MSSEELADAVRFELEAMRLTVEELAAIMADAQERQPTLRDRTAAGAFLAQFYTGVENILKRIHEGPRADSVTDILPKGPQPAFS